jgi:hypothetical protein
MALVPERRSVLQANGTLVEGARSRIDEKFLLETLRTLVPLDVETLVREVARMERVLAAARKTANA